MTSMQKPYQHMDDEQLSEHLSRLPAIPDNLPLPVAIRAGVEVVYADVWVDKYNNPKGLAFYCKYCDQYHFHSEGNGMRKAHCHNTPKYKFGQYYLKSTGINKVILP